MTDRELNAVSRTTFAAEGVKERDGLQRLLRENLDVLGQDLLLISEEFQGREGSQRRIDLLAIDREANLVVIELKRGETGAHMELQALRYAALAAPMVFEDVVAELAVTEQISQDEAEERLLDFLDSEPSEGGEFNAEVRIILVSADFSKELVATVLWLNDHGLDIRCVRLRPHRVADRLVLNIDPMIPLPEAGDYVFKQRAKTEARRVARASAQGWTGHWFFNVGDLPGGHRRWEDARRYGFIQAGGAPRYRDKLLGLGPGDRVLAYLKGHGYVGVGVVAGVPRPLRDFVVESEGKPLVDLSIMGTVDQHLLDDDERGEFCAAVCWETTVPRESAVRIEFFRRGIACHLMRQSQVDAVIAALREAAAALPAGTGQSGDAPQS